MVRAKKEYTINSTLSMRLTEKAGVTEEIIGFLNDQDSGKVSQEVFKAIKYWIRTQGANDRIRKTVEEEAMKMESKLARYGENRGPYKKHGESEEEIERLKEEILRLKAKEKPVPEKKPVPKPSPRPQPEPAPPPEATSEIAASEELDEAKDSETSTYEDELFGTHNSEENGNPMLKALKSIPKLG